MGKICYAQEEADGVKDVRLSRPVQPGYGVELENNKTTDSAI